MPVPIPLRVLLVDDQPDMARSVARALQQGGFDPRCRRVETERQYRQSLDADLDVVVAADTLPQFDARRALRTLRRRGLDIPFIVLTSESGEEVALECLTQGAADYLFRDRLGRLGSAVERALNARRLRQEKQQAETASRQREILGALLSMAEALVEVPQAPGAPGSEWPAAGIVGHRLAELTRSVLACRHVAIIAVEPESELLHPIAVTGFSAEDEPRWWGQWESHPRLSDRLDPPHIAQMRAEGVLLLDRTRPPFKRETALGRRIVLMVPLRRGDAITGVLSVDHGDQEHDYTPDEIALTRAVGRLAALVIERERLLHEREEARAGELALREANRRLDEFLSIASHELRTPLTTILGATQLARRRARTLASRAGLPAADESDATDAIDRLLVRAEYQARRLNGLVYDLLDVSRIQADHLELRLTSCDLGAIVAEAVDEQRQAWPERIITLTTPVTPVHVTADRDRLGQVVTNYLTNALKYAPADRPIEVTVDWRDGKAHVVVRDEGPGLTPEQQRFVWDRFHRVRGIAVQAGGDNGGGLGLGLYISRTIVERHGGCVGVDSTPGLGSAFWFTLPQIPPDERL